MGQTYLLTDKEIFLKFCEKLFNDGQKNGFLLVFTPNELRSITHVEKRRAMKLRTDVLVAADMFKQENSVAPLTKSFIFTFVAVPKEQIKEEALTG